ncbi:hypothetical protein PM082_022885 [Marasmius tenuissimus]|nr:hypothetical protein PM082_022885 [Marasmius tenuissimus]
MTAAFAFVITCLPTITIRSDTAVVFTLNFKHLRPRTLLPHQFVFVSQHQVDSLHSTSVEWVLYSAISC